MRVMVVIPTYNEIENIAAIITDVLASDPRVDILIVDDNSPDGTSSVVEQMKNSNPRIHLMKRPGKMGLGTAYCDGFRYALSLGYDVVMEMDADFSHDPKEIPVFLAELQNYDVVIGSRYSNGVNVVNWPMERLLLSYFANYYTRVITGMPVKDATGGFKAFRSEFLRRIDFAKVRSNGYAFQIEMNFRLWSAGARIKEIPIIFIDRRSGTSKMSKNIVYEAALLVWKLKFLSIFGRLG